MDMDNKPVKMTASLRVLQVSREVKTEREVEEEFKEMEKKKTA